MFRNVIGKARRTLGRVAARLLPTAVEFKVRQQAAFERLHPGVEQVKSSPTVQIAFGAAVTGLVLTGRWSAAAGVAGTWLASRQLTRAAAAGVGVVGMVDDRLRADAERAQCPPADLLHPALETPS